MRKFSIYFIVFFFVFASTASTSAQDKPQWFVSFQKSIDWYYLTSSGILLVCNNENFIAIDPLKKDTVWTLPAYKRLPISNLKNLPNSPYIEISNFQPYEEEAPKAKGILGMAVKLGNNTSSHEDKGRSIILDPVQGKIIFDSKQLELESLASKSYLPSINSFFIQGEIKGKNNRVMGVYDLSQQKLLWLKEKPVKLKFFTLRDELIPKIDPEENIIFSYAENTYRFNRLTGELLWQRLQDSLYQIEFSSNKSFFYGSGGNHISKLNLATGQTIMEIRPSGYKTMEAKSSFMKKMFQNGITILPGENGLLASFDYNFNLYDYVTLQPKWLQNPSFKPFHVKNVITQPNGKLLVALKDFSGSINAITIMDTSGKILWEKPYVIEGNFTKYVEYTEDGLVYVTNEIGDVVDWNTGKSKLSHPLSFDKDEFIMVTHAKDKHCFAFYTNNKLIELNYSTAAVRQLLNKTGFKGDPADKQPNLLEARPDGYILSAPQNIVFVGYDGSVKYQKYYDPPGMSEKMRGLLFAAGGLAVGYVFSTQAQQVTNAMYNTGMTDLDTYSVVYGFDKVYGGTGSAIAMAGISHNAFAREKARNTSIKSVRNYQLILAKLKTGGNGFIKIDKDTGNELQNIRLDDKTPTVKIDDALPGMYYISPDEKMISFYSLIDN